MSEPAADEPPGVPEWVVTYGDMMSLLLTFFIMLVSMSELKQDGHVRAMMDALQQRFGPTDGRAGAPGPAPPVNGSFKKPVSGSDNNEGGVKESSRKSDGNAGPEMTVERVRDGTVITLGGPTMFALDSAEPTPQLLAGVGVLAEVLADRPNRIVVRGHSSPEELGERPDGPSNDGPAYPDRETLSFARATSVADALVAAGIDRKRLLLSAVGDSEPNVVTRSDDLRRRNRRVDVFVVDSYTTAPQPSGTDEP